MKSSLTKRIISIAAFICDAAIIYNIVKHGLCKETSYKSLVILCIFGLIWCFAHIVEIIHSKSEESSKSELEAAMEDAAAMMGEDKKDDGSYFVTIPIMSNVTNTAISVTIINKKYIRIVDNTIYVVDDDNNVGMVYKDVLNVFPDKDKEILEELRVSIDELNNVPNIGTSEGDDDDE